MVSDDVKLGLFGVLAFYCTVRLLMDLISFVIWAVGEVS